MPKGTGAKGAMVGTSYEIGAATLESSKKVDVESGNAVLTALPSEAESVSLTIKVPLSYRRHWQIEAKRRNTSVTSLIVEALREKLGLPE